MRQEKTGGCACGAVRYRLTRDPLMLLWVRLPQGARAVPDRYELEEVWPPEMLQRLRTNA